MSNRKDKAARDNRANQRNPNHKVTNNNRANQLNPNHKEFRPKGK